jgi:hypothetical protein
MAAAMTRAYSLALVFAAACTTSSSHATGPLQLEVDLLDTGSSGTYHEVMALAGTPNMACGVQMGACSLEPPSGVGDSTTTPKPSASAGTITARDQTTNAVIGTMAYDHANGYAYVSSLQALWNAGDAITLEAPGADVPGFTIDMTAPTPVAGVTPALMFGNSLTTVTRGHDLAVHWTPVGGSQEIDVTFTPYFTVDQGNPSIHCMARDADGQLVIPGALLAFPDFNSTQPVESAIYITRTTTVDTGSPDLQAVTRAQVGGDVSLQ